MTRSVRTIVALAAAAFLSRCAGCTSEEDTSCPSGQERCQGFCRDPASYATDPANCGGCGVACGFGTCAGGACQCEGGTLCPAGVPRCADLSTDPLNCGACGNDCPKVNEGCAGGVCGCIPPFPDDCGTLCTDLQTDAAHCGTCDTNCPLTNDVCVAATCTCPATLPDTCGSTCVDLASDESHCGGCATTCATGATCTSGACECPAGEDVCDGVCVDWQTDESNCGSCGTTCATRASCDAGTCTCPAAQTTVCGVTSGSAGTCCAGNGCCSQTIGGSTCQTEHSNGLGQHFYDCLPLGTYNVTQAEKAAAAWQPSGTEISGVLFNCPGCIGWQATVGTISYCGTWCHSDALAGRAMLVQSLLCGCPFAAAPNWN